MKLRQLDNAPDAGDEQREARPMTRTAGTNRNEAAENLKRVARRLFAERGVDGVTVRQIAERSGVGEATVKRLMAALRKADVVRLEYGGRWILNPAVMFKGGHTRRMNVLIRYQSMEQQELPLEVSEADRKAA